MKFATPLALAALSAVANGLADGLLCVPQNLIDVFDAINAVRADLTSSQSWVDLNNNLSAWDSATHAYWTTSDGTNEAIISGESYLTDAVAAVSNLSSAIDAFTWAEGLADATELVATDYTTNGNTSVTGTDGSTTNTRAN